MTALNNSDAAPVVARFANPGALGLGAFALTTFVLSFANAGWVPSRRRCPRYRLVLWRYRSSDRGHLGVREQEHLRRDGVYVVRPVLDGGVVPEHLGSQSGCPGSRNLLP